MPDSVAIETRPAKAPMALKRVIGPSGFFTLAVGAMVGSGWVVVLGDWLRAAGPGGAIVGFVAGGATMICIAMCYGELASRSGRAGGEFLFVRDALGRGPAFLVGWFLTLFAAAVCAFESVVLATLIHTLFPGMGAMVLYRVGGQPIDASSLAIGFAGATLVGLLHWGGAHGAIRFQNIVTFGFITLMVVVITLGIALGNPKNLAPAFQSMDGRSWTYGAVWVFSLCAFFLNGWQSALHAIEERREGISVAHAIRAVVGGTTTATRWLVPKQ